MVAITTFGHGSFGRLRDIRIDNDYRNKLKEAGITDRDLRKYGIASEIGCLTISEAAKLTRMVKSRTKDRTTSDSERLPSLRQFQSSVSAVAKEFPTSEERTRVTISAVETNAPRTYIRR